MVRFFAFFLGAALCLLSSASFGQQTAVVNGSANVEVTEKVKKEPEPLVTTTQPPQVGKHVLANMDAGSMIMSLLMVLALIIISALVLKRFNLTQQGSSQLKVIASLSLGAKERVVVIQIGEQQLVLGVCPQQISLLQNLEKPIDVQAGKPLAVSTNILSFLQKNNISANTNNSVPTNKTTNNT